MEDQDDPEQAFDWWSTAATKGGLSWAHNGAIDVSGGRGTYAEVIIYPNGYIAAFVANSPQPSQDFVKNTLVKAYNDSLRSIARLKSSTSKRGAGLARDRARRR